MGVGNGVSRDVYTSFLQEDSKFIIQWGNWANSICVTRPFQVWLGGHWKNFIQKLRWYRIFSGYFKQVLCSVYIVWRIQRGWPIIIAFSNDEANIMKGLLVGESSLDDFSGDGLFGFLEQISLTYKLLYFFSKPTK